MRGLTSLERATLEIVAAETAARGGPLRSAHGRGEVWLPGEALDALQEVGRVVVRQIDDGEHTLDITPAGRLALRLPALA